MSLRSDDSPEEAVYVYPYIDQAHQMARRQLLRRSFQQDDATGGDVDEASRGGLVSSTLVLDFRHILQADMEVAEAIQMNFLRFEPFLRRAVQSFVHEVHPELDNDMGGAGQSNQGKNDQSYFLAFCYLPTVCSLRDLRSDDIGRLKSITGTVTRTSEVRPELLVGCFRCQKCGLLAASIPQQYHYTRPTLCRNPRCKNASPRLFVLDTAQSEFVDWQKLRLQECSQQIPPGCMPRSLDVIVRHDMVERVKAGDRCVLTGSLVVVPDGSALARAGEAPRAVAGRGGPGGPSDAAKGGGGGVGGLAALGVRELTYRTCFVANCVAVADAHGAGDEGSINRMLPLLFGNQQRHEQSAEEVVMEFTREERAEIRSMKSSPRLYEQMVDSIAPTTFGHKEVKKGVLLMMLGGVHKTTSDGIKLRGDINVCIVGDPSTAKSQFLKYVHAFLPSRSVYTSGKASTAAGLTAAVQRDQDTGEYTIEAGALMLAENGVCCVDEFDKQDPHDQVAIHEAMEQQTISITKAGIQATLNARASILAAANPIYGRYDRTKTLKANVALSAPILSRFDLFFVVLDECNPESDRHVAQHILKVHRCQEDAVRPPFTTEQMQRYIRFARTIHPQITVESQRVLVDCYRKLRQGDTLGRSRSAYRITVRQLESMIRLGEALARLHCDQEIKPTYVREAFRLLKTSIIQVETSDVDVEDVEEDEDENAGDEHRPGTEGEIDEGAGNLGGENDESLGNDQVEGEQPPDAPFEPRSDESSVAKARDPTSKSKTKKKTKISFDEYESIANAIAIHLRSLESEDPNDESTSQYLKWKEVVDWYLNQVEHEIGESMESLEDMRKKVNLVVRRLVNVDLILVTVGAAPKNKREEQNTLLAVHPNFVTS